MPWPLFFVHVTEERYQIGDVSGFYYADDAGRKFVWDELPIGACWYADGNWATQASDKYRAQHEANRKPLWVKLPSKSGREGGVGGTCFCVDSNATTSGLGWDVTGDPPKITVSPSINIVGRYHGYIRDGVITDDCDGRTFP